MEICISSQIQLVGTIFAALFGLAFGSFLNVVISRLPEGESIAVPRSHCRNCDHTLAWWENLPVLSWLLLRGRCRQCQTRISIRYPFIELAVGVLWTLCWIKFGPPVFGQTDGGISLPLPFAYGVARLAGDVLLCWLLVALAALDIEYLWLPDRLTLSGLGLGIFWTILELRSIHASLPQLMETAWHRMIAILACAGIILFIRLAYWLIRRKEGMGLGDAKLMAMLGAWLGLGNALECLVLSVFTASLAALVWMAISAIRGNKQDWAKMPLPLGTFLCLAALSEIFYPEWLWTWYSRTFLP